MNKCWLLTLIVIFSSIATAQEKRAVLVPKTKPAPAMPRKSIKQLIEEDKVRKVESYYDAAHIKSLDQKKIQKHAPMLIIIDERQTENAIDDNIPMIQELAYGIKAKLYPILTTSTILSGLITRQDKNRKNISEKDKEIQDFIPPINPQEWQILNVPESQFVLLIPTNFKTMYGSNTGIKPLPDITNFLDGASNFMLKSLLDKKKKIVPFSKADLDKVFITKTDANSGLIWDFIVAGHGTDNPPIIANISPAAINEMFNFFDTKIKTGMVLVISCLAGGRNRKLLESTQAGIQINHNFILILNSVANENITATFPRDFAYASFFFNNAAQIQDKGSSFDALWEDLAKAKLFSYKSSVHGLQNIPQVWFPGGLGFQSANIADLVFPIGNVLLKTSKENNEPIIIMGDALVLIYPSVIDVPLNVFPARVEHLSDKRNWADIPHLFELPFSKGDKHLSAKIITELVEPRLNNQTTLFSEALARLFDSLYPQFISLNPAPSGHLFTEITVETIFMDETSTIKGLGMGVIHFIRDAFMDANENSGSRVFFIDKLTGFNDISLLLEGSRLVRKDSNKHPMENYLQNFVGQNITLENVLAIINNTPTTRFNLYFAIGDTYWHYDSLLAQEDAKTANWWNFRMAGNVRSSYDADYLKYKNQFLQKPESINQKSISAVLEEKQRQILLKKAMELKKNTVSNIPKPSETSTAKTPVLLKPKTMPAPAIPNPK